MKKIILLFAFFSFLIAYNPQTIIANHLVGGELTYTCIGGNSFEINLTIYRDCNCVSCADFDDPAPITVFNSSGGVETTFQIFSPTIVNVEPDVEGLCLESIPDVCVERGFYSTIVDLPPIPGGFQLAYQRCCRNNTIQNIVDPGGTGSTYVATIPEEGFANCQNSAPTFNNLPPIIICANSPLVFDHSATDADGDSLVYEICEPVVGASMSIPAPGEASPPPYDPVTYLPGFSFDNPFGSTAPIEIDPVTGLLTGFPETTGQYVVGICVSEYQDGVLIGTNRRDFQFNVADCEIVLAQANVGGDVYLCLGETTTLNGEVFGEEVWEWSPITGLSDPMILNPVVDITETTSYVLNAVNLTTGCEDFDTITVFIIDPIAADAGDDALICADPVQLQGSGGDVYSWSPGAGLSNPDTCCPIANPDMTTIYTLTVADSTGSCTGSDEVTVTVGADIAVDAGDDVSICEGESAALTADGGVSYVWTPADGLDNATSCCPIASPTVTTEYVVTAMDEAGCMGSDTITVFVTPLSDPGTMSADTQFACDGETVSATSTSFSLADGDVLGYVLHTSATAELGTILASNTSGTFAMSAGISTNTEYYVSAVAGPEGSPAGFPDLDHPCLVTNAGTPVVFLKEVVIDTDHSCDDITYELSVVFNIRGGLPEFDAFAEYTVTGSFLGSVPFGENNQIGPYPGGESYSLTAMDALGCAASPVGVDSVDCKNTPIELLRFEGKVLPEGNLLEWATASEIDNDYFTLSRSADGISFENIAQIEGNETSTILQNYDFLDLVAPTGLSYYRLHQTDVDGQVHYAGVVSLLRGSATFGIEYVTPVPASDRVNLGFVVATDTDVELTVYAVTGQLVHQQKLQATNGLNNMDLDIANFSSGVYFVTLNDGQQMATTKLVVE